MIQTFTLNDLTQLQQIMNRELKKVKKWLDGNRLEFNIDRPIFVVFHSPQIKIFEPVIIRVGGKKVNVKVMSNFQESYWMKI